MNLHGAKGLLVNITAGPDMAIGEFEAVGNAIHEYAAPDANVVIGTAFDPGMQGDLRVTMVATGLADSRASAAELEPVEAPVIKAVEPIKPVEEEAAPAMAMPGKRFATGGLPGDSGQPDMDRLDIPAFLRKQAD